MPSPKRGARCRLTEDEVRTRLCEKGFEMVGAYAGVTRSRATVRCREGHEWHALIDNLIKKNGTGCPHCKGMAKLTFEEVERRLTPRGIRMVDGEPRAVTRATFECSNGHTWEARLGTVLIQTSCPHCRSNRPLTRDDVNARIAERGYVLSGEYVNAGARAEFKCSNGHNWVAIPDNILRGKGCPSCAEYGFNPEHPACFYTIRIFSESGEYVGFGITKDKETRFSYHARAIRKEGFDFEVLDTLEFESGHDARALEELVKENLPVVDSGIKGFRKEAIPATAYVQLQQLMETLTS